MPDQVISLKDNNSTYRVIDPLSFSDLYRGVRRSEGEILDMKLEALETKINEIINYLNEEVNNA